MHKRRIFAYLTAEDNKLTQINGLTHVIQSGAVYGLNGKIISESLRTNGIDRDLIISANKARLTIRERLTILVKAIYRQRVDLSADYCGPHFSQFGHFLTESLSRIPTNRKKIKKVLFHPYDGDKNFQDINDYQRELLDLLDIKKVKIIKKSRIAFNIKIHAEQVVLNQKISSHAVQVWKTIVNNSRPGRYSPKNHKIFLSRKELHPSLKRVDEEIEQKTEKNYEQQGFLVIHPEKLFIREQIQLINSATMIAGFSGSALHLSVFCKPNTLIIEIGDQRSPTIPNSHQQNICDELGLKHKFIPYEVN